MKNFLSLFILFFFLNLQSQISTEPRQLYVVKDSVTFIGLSKKGANTFVLDGGLIKLKGFQKHSMPIPKELEFMDFDGLSGVFGADGKLYLLYPGGGILFEYHNNIIRRIDNSFAHRNQFSGHFFIYKNNLYLLGGYGYWRTNSLLTRFNFNSKEWDYVQTFGQTPSKGINEASFFLDKNILTVFDFYYRVNDIDQKNNNLYELDLELLVWGKKGSLNRSFYDDIEKKSREIGFKTPLGVFKKSLGKETVRFINPSKNSIKIYSSDALRLLTPKSFSVGNKIITTQLSADRSFEVLLSKDLIESLKYEGEEFLTNDYNLFVSYFVVAGVFCLMLVGFVYFKAKKSSYYFILSNESIIGQNKSLQISQDEYFILKLLSDSKSGEVENTYFLNYFKSPELSTDACIKRKNKAISDLNNRFVELHGMKIIIKKTKKSDSRQVLYMLNEKIKF
jgi:hypothetical protein